MGLKQVTDRVYYMDFMDETDRPTLSYVKGDKYALAIDAGNSKNHIDKFYSLLSNLGLPKPEYTVITHYHWDHTFGMNFISGKSIVCDKTNEKLIEMQNWLWTKEEMERRVEENIDTEFCKINIMKEYPDLEEIKVVTGDISFKNELVVDLGGVKCFLKHIESPHTEDSVLVHIPSERVLVVGDADCGDYINLNGKYDKLKLKFYIEFIETLDFDKYIIGHDEMESKEVAIKYLYEELRKL